MIALRAVSTLAQGVASSVTLKVPEGVEPGDLLLAVLELNGDGALTITAPGGWERVQRTNDTGHCLAVYRRRYVDSVDSSPTWTLSYGAQANAAVVAYGGVDHATPVEAAAGQANGASFSATAPSVTTTGANACLVAVWGIDDYGVTVTPAAGMTERVNVPGPGSSIPQGLSIADAIQGTPGASGTRVATLDFSEASIGVLMALKAAALNSVEAVRDEGGWRYEAFAPRITSDTKFDAFVGGVIQRVNRDLFRRVGEGFYTANVLADPWNALLQRAEMHLAQAELLSMAAGLVGTADAQDEEMRPYIGRPAELRAQALDRRRQAREIVALCRTRARPGPGFPFFTASGTGVERVRPLFDDEEGLLE